MPEKKTSLFIVAAEPSNRKLLLQILTENGYAARSTTDGFSALVEISHEVPDFLICDLNMPGMSAIDLLSVVRRRFPAIRVIAMSAFSGDEAPSGVDADAFIRKGRAFGDLLMILKSLPLPERLAQQPVSAPSPVWISRYERNAAGESYATIECSECLGTFPMVLHGTIHPTNEANCLFCGSVVRYAIFQPDELPFLLPFPHERSAQRPALESMQKLEL